MQAFKKRFQAVVFTNTCVCDGCGSLGAELFFTNTWPILGKEYLLPPAPAPPPSTSVNVNGPIYYNKDGSNKK